MVNLVDIVGQRDNGMTPAERLEGAETKELALAFSNEFVGFKIEKEVGNFLAIGSVKDVVALGVMVATGINANELGHPDRGLDPGLLAEDAEVRFNVREVFHLLDGFASSEKNGTLLEELDKPRYGRYLDRDQLVMFKVESVEDGDQHTMALRIFPGKYARGDEGEKVAHELEAIVRDIAKSRKGIEVVTKDGEAEGLPRAR